MFTPLDSNAPNTPKQAPRSKSPRLPPNDSMTPLAPAVEDMALDCIFCLCSLPVDSTPLTDPESVAQLVPCKHFMHNECLKPWTEIANTCPICRVSFNQVNVLPYMTGSALNSWRVEDKIQEVAYQMPPEEHYQIVSAGDYQILSEEQAELGAAGIDTRFLDIRAAARIRSLQHEWAAAWEHLDANLDFGEDTMLDGFYDQSDEHQNLLRRQRRLMRRAVAAMQTRDGQNPFDEEPAWTIPTARPRATFPHLEPHISKEESDSWKMMEIAEEIEENSKQKRRRSPNFDQSLLTRMGIDLSVDPAQDGRKFKRPRTKRDSQLPAINTRNNNANGESSGSRENVPMTVSTPNDAGSPPSGGIFTSLLEGIGKYQEVPIISAADVSGCDLTRMRPISPDRSGFASAVSRSDSSPAMYSLSSPPSSRPTSPFNEPSRGRPTHSCSSTTRTPAHSPARIGGNRPWEAQRQQQPISPPASRMQSPQGRLDRRYHSHSPRRHQMQGNLLRPNQKHQDGSNPN